MRGWSRVSLDREGVADAHKVGKALKGRGLGLFICSDLPRAVETTEILSKETGAPLVTKSPDLRTWGMGELEGSGLKDAERIINWYLRHPNESPKRGESANKFKARALRKLAQIMDTSLNNKVIIAVVTHHSVVNLLMLWVKAGCPPDLNVDLADMIDFKEDPPGSVYDMRFSAGKWTMPIVPPGTDFWPGPVIIRHEHTASN